MFSMSTQERLYYFDHESTRNCKSTSTLCQLFPCLFFELGQGLVFLESYLSPMLPLLNVPLQNEFKISYEIFLYFSPIECMATCLL
jgi:hypothetical protein